MNEDEKQVLYDRASEAIDVRVRGYVGSHCQMIYSAYETDANEVPIDNLDEIPISGKVRFVAERWDESWSWGCKQSKNYCGPVVESPTWLQICGFANAAMRKTLDRHHVYLESVEVVGQEGDVQIAKFHMGS